MSSIEAIFTFDGKIDCTTELIEFFDKITEMVAHFLNDNKI